MDVRTGGTGSSSPHRRTAIRATFEFEGEYLEVDPPQRIVQTLHNGWNGLTTTETIELEDLGDNRTRLTQTSTFSTVEERDGAVTNGAEMGAKYQFGQLNQLLGKMAGGK